MVLHLVDQVLKAVHKLQDKTVKVFQFRFQELNKEEDKDLFVKYQEMEVVVEVEEDHLIMVDDKNIERKTILIIIYVNLFI